MSTITQYAADGRFIREYTGEADLCRAIAIIWEQQVPAGRITYAAFTGVLSSYGVGGRAP